MEKQFQHYEPDKQEQITELRIDEGLAEKEFKGKLFTLAVNNHLFNESAEAMENCGFSESNISEIKKEYEKLNLEDQKYFLSIPWELREKRFSALQQQLIHRKISAKEVVGALSREAALNKFTLGYHLSKHYTEPMTGKNPKWNISGSEMDDRDDMKMAYYGFDYENLYRKKGADNLYVVRVDESKRIDTTNHWGRAQKLPIVGVLDMQSIDEEVKKMYLDKRQKEKFVE